MGALNLRARIFLPVFGIACLASLAYVFSRPAVYLSTARLQIEAPQDSPGLFSESLTLISGTLLEQVAQRQGGLHPAALREMLSAVPVSGSNVIELRAEGGERELLPRILSAWIEVYRQSHVEVRDQSSTAALDELRSTVRQLQENLATKRRGIEAFRSKHDIVSVERDENQSMARLKGLNTALNDARTREVNAEARLNAMRESAAAGRAVRPPGEKANIAELEKRALDLREKMKVLEQDYTPQYLAIDTGYKAMRANLTRLEQQIEREQQTGAQQAMQAAEDEAAGARQTILRLQTELAARKQEVQEFSARFAEHTALANELVRLEDAHNAENVRLAQFEMGSKATGPTLMVISQPSLPDRPVHPDYARDALLGVAGSGVFGLFAVWFVEFFRRSGVPQPAPPAQPIIQIAIAPGAIAEALFPAQGAPAPRLPEAAARLPRELSAAEVDALLAAAAPDRQPLIAALLGGRASPADALSAAEIDTLIADAAGAADLANPAEVTAEVLRYTFIAHQIRQRN